MVGTSAPSESPLRQSLGPLTKFQGNQAYATVERKIRSVKLPSALDRSSSMRNQCQQRENEWHECQRPQEISSFQGFQRNPFVSLAVADCGLTKDDLRRFKVIDQVDRKFIACRIPTRSSHPQGVPAYHLHSRSEDVLILIDQHAADERVRVERFLKELCIGFLNSQYREDGEWVQGVRIKELSPPRPVLLTEHEALTVIRSQKIRESLRKWGVQIVFAPNNVPVSDGMSEPGSSGYTQVLVSTIPEVVGEKVRTPHCRLVCHSVYFVNLSSIVAQLASCSKETNCEISFKDSLDRSKVENSLRIPIWIFSPTPNEASSVG